MKIKVKVLSEGCMPAIIKKGEWIDLKTRQSMTLHAPKAETLRRKKVGDDIQDYRQVSFDYQMIPLGVAMQIPEGYEAVIVPRSSSFKNWGIIQTNSMGVIDSSYCGNNDEWKMPIIGTREAKLILGERVCQFRIQLSQKATIWQKIKWLFTNKIELIQVDSLGDVDRGGFGSTGK